MTHKFDPKNLQKLDNPKRKEMLPPDITLNQLGLKSGEVFLDIGAGTGYFSFPAASIVGRTGKVLAVDPSEPMVEEMRKRALQYDYPQVQIIRSLENDLKVPDHCADFGLMCSVLHEIDDKPGFLAMVKKALKPGATLAIIEWIKQPMDMGPPVDERFGLEETVRLLTDWGFDITLKTEFSGKFYGVTARLH